MNYYKKEFDKDEILHNELTESYNVLFHNTLKEVKHYFNTLQITVTRQQP